MRDRHLFAGGLSGALLGNLLLAGANYADTGLSTLVAGQAIAALGLALLVGVALTDESAFVFAEDSLARYAPYGMVGCGAVCLLAGLLVAATTVLA